MNGELMSREEALARFVKLDLRPQDIVATKAELNTMYLDALADAFRYEVAYWELKDEDTRLTSRIAALKERLRILEEKIT